MTERRRLQDLDRCRGLAILLVVFGHLIARGTPEGYEWYRIAKKMIYDFHMPLFVYLSGYVFFLTGSHLKNGAAWGDLVARRAYRLLVPFLAVGLLIVLAKYFAQFVVTVDQPPSSLLSGARSLFLDTKDSPALSIWYVWVLFVLSVVTPLVWKAAGRWVFFIAPALLLLGLAPITDDFYLDRVARFSGFFLLAGAAAVAGDRWLAIVDRWRWVFLALFLVSFVLLAFNVDWRIRLIVTGALSVPAIHGLIRAKVFDGDRSLLWLAGQAFVIYLINTLFIGATKGVIGKLAPFEGWVVGLSLPVLFAAGVLGPILFRELILRRSRRLYEITR